MGTTGSPTRGVTRGRLIYSGLCAAELLEVIVWLTPAGTTDEGGVEQPAYLNFDTGLLGPPHGNKMQVPSSFLGCV